MLPIDDTDWLEDLWVTLPERETGDHADAIRETLISTASKVPAAGWLVVPGAAGSVLGGMLASTPVRSSWSSLFAYLAALPAVWWTVRWLTGRLLGLAIRWQAVVLFFFTFLMGTGAVFAAGVQSKWWAYALSAGLGLLLGLVYGSLDPTSVRNKDLWLAAGLALGPASTLATTYLQRHASGSSPLAAVVSAAGIGGSIFAAPMAALLVRQWDNSLGLRQLGLLYLHHDAWLPRSVEYLTAALALAPDDVGLLNLRGVARSRLGELAGADADWQRALELHKGSVEPLTHRANMLIRQGSLSESLAILESAVTIEPRAARTHASLGLALARSGDRTRAMQHYDRALELEPRLPSTHAHRAAERLHEGAFDLAIKDCDRALDVCPDYALPHLLRGRAYAGLGERGEAAESYQEAIRAAPDQSVADEARRELSKLS